MLSPSFYSRCVYIRSGTRLRLLPVGGLLCISFAPSHSDKMIAIKQRNNALLSLAYHGMKLERHGIVVECMPIARYAAWHLYRNTHPSACDINAALLFEYTSYSQTQWRYIRYLFGSTATEAFIQHTELLDLQALKTHGLTHLKHTYVMFLRHFTTNISSYFFVSRYASSLLRMSRSRTINNVCNSPALILTDVTDSCGTLCVTASDDDADYYNEQQSLDTDNLLYEQQVNIAGVLHTNHISSLSDMCVFTSFTYISFYANVYKVIALACSLVLYSLSYLLCYMHLLAMFYNFLYICNNTVVLAYICLFEYTEYAADTSETDTEDSDDSEDFEDFIYYDCDLHEVCKQEAANISTISNICLY